MERTAVVIRQVDTEIVDAVGLGADQRVVAVVEKRDRKAAAEMRDAGKFPAFGETV